QLQRELIEQLPQPQRQRGLLARTLLCKAAAQRQQGKRADARATAVEARELLLALQRDPAVDRKGPIWRVSHYDLGGVWSTLGMRALEEKNDAQEAVVHFRDAIAALETAVKAAPNNLDFRSQLVYVCTTAGIFLRTTVPPEEALRWLERSRDLLD